MGTAGRELKIAVIGGGITGLSAAYALRREASARGRSVCCTVFERDGRFGGKILTYRENGFVLEAGPDSLLARKPAGVELVQSLGVASELVGLDASRQHTFILRGGRLRPLPPGTQLAVPTSLAAIRATDLLTPLAKARVMLDLWLPARAGQGDESLGRLLRRRFGNEWGDVVAEPILAGIYAGRIDELSVRATFPHLREWERRHGSLIRAAQSEARARRSTVASAPGQPQETGVAAEPSAANRGHLPASGAAGAVPEPALGEPAPRPLQSAFVTLKGGLGTLIERLFDELCDWAELVTQAEVTGLERRPEGGWRLRVLERNQSAEVDADGVIVATPAFAAAPLLAPVCSAARALGDIPYVSTATVIAAFPADAVPSGAGTGFLVPRREGRAITACTVLSTKWPHTCPRHVAVFRCFIGRAGDTERLRLDDGELVQAAVGDLRAILGITASPLFTRVTRWPNAMPQYRPGHLDLLDAVEGELAASAPAVAIAGAGYRGLGIPDCIVQGERAAKQVLDALVQ